MRRAIENETMSQSFLNVFFRIQSALVVTVAVVLPLISTVELVQVVHVGGVCTMEPVAIGMTEAAAVNDGGDDGGGTRETGSC